VAVADGIGIYMHQASLTLLGRAYDAIAHAVARIGDAAPWMRPQFMSATNMKRVGTGLIVLTITSVALTLWWTHAWAVALGFVVVALYAFTLLRALAGKSRELELTLNHMTQGIIMMAPDRKVPVINQRAIELLDLPKSMASPSTTFDDILNHQRHCQEFGKDGIAVEPAIWDFIKQGGGSTSVPFYERVRPNGTALEIRSVALPDGGLVRTYTDITERKRAEAEVRAIALRDELTGLANRARLREHLQGSFQRLQRTGDGFCVISLDLDRLKAINDTLGHAVGDVLLQQVATRLLQCVDKNDLVARVGPDQFVIVNANVDHPHSVIPLVHMLLTTVGAPYSVNGQRLIVATSIGIATAPNDGDTPDRLMKNADLALHASKKNGRGVFSFFEPELQVAADGKARMAAEMRDALAGDQFEVHYLPWINCETGRIAGCEALARWRHPSLGLIGPSEFIPVAEECGLIATVGDWVLRRATVEARQWPDNVRLAVNVSAGQFLGNDLSGSVQQALSNSGFPANRLELEVTESLLLFERGDQRAMLQQLSRQGVHMALDDFGTGYSSFRYLDLFPFNRIKIDRSFVANVTKRPHCAAIVTAAIDLGRNLEMRTTAEGVESQDQYAFLKQRGCEDVQGYLFGRPCRGPELLDRLTRSIVVNSAA
jgi:diguanylate cyclase (GGDEF)-like protein